MSTEETLRSQPHTDAAYTLGQLTAILAGLEVAARFAASSDLRSRVVNACAEAKAIREAYDARSKERLREVTQPEAE